MKRYTYEEWYILDGTEHLGWDDRVYVDSNNNRITGILEGFYGYTSNTKDEQNCEYVENGIRNPKEGK